MDFFCLLLNFLDLKRGEEKGWLFGYYLDLAENRDESYLKPLSSRRHLMYIDVFLMFINARKITETQNKNNSTQEK